MKYHLFVWLVVLLTSVSAYVNGYIYPECYVGVLGGANFIEDNKQGLLDVDMQVGGVVGAFVGCRFNGIRLEAEVAYRRNDLLAVKEGEFSLGGKGRMEVSTVMVNALYELPLPILWTPYVGFGIGYCRVDELIFARYLERNEIDNAFAWQAIVGVCRPLTYSVDLGFEYRYLQPGMHFYDHAIALSLKHLF